TSGQSRGSFGSGLEAAHLCHRSTTDVSSSALPPHGSTQAWLQSLRRVPKAGKPSSAEGAAATMDLFYCAARVSALATSAFASAAIAFRPLSGLKWLYLSVVCNVLWPRILPTSKIGTPDAT